MFKNVASQKIEVFAFDYTTGAPKTGDSANITVYLSKDGGTVTALTDTTATEISSTNAPGWYQFDVSQTESNADMLLFTGKSSTANVSIVGTRILTRPNRFTSMVIDSSGNPSILGAMKKNVAFSAFEFMMTDSTTHAPVTGKTVSVTRSIDGGAFSAGTLSAVTEIGVGMYKVDFAAADLNGNNIVLRATATGCDDTFERIITTP